MNQEQKNIIQTEIKRLSSDRIIMLEEIEKTKAKLTQMEDQYWQVGAHLQKLQEGLLDG